jgi:hypothetical protein
MPDHWRGAPTAIRELPGARLDDPAQRFDIELAVRLYLAGQKLARHG